MLLVSVYLWLEFLCNLITGSGLRKQIRKPIWTDVWRSLGQGEPKAIISPGNEDVLSPKGTQPGETINYSTGLNSIHREIGHSRISSNKY